MSVKLAVTVCNCDAVVHAGGDVERVTAIVELRDDQIPKILKEYLQSKAKAEEHSKKHNSPTYFYSTLAFSILDETTAA